MLRLPVDDVLPELRRRLSECGRVILEAPPGSGKTTRVAPALVRADDSVAEGQTYLLQPRRVACRAGALRIATENNWKLGQEVGYHVRFDRKLTSETKLVVATEGILLRRMLDDPTLDGVSTVVLDEFHERSVNSDLLLAMLCRIQNLIRQDMRLIVMSATLETEALSQFMECPVLSTSGTAHPVETRYRAPRSKQRMVEHAAETIRLTLENERGDLLVFLPGVGEISAVKRLLESDCRSFDVEIHELHGRLPLEQQNRVLRQSDRRRVILSTNIAETSLTIEGIRVVIDSGQARVLRFEPTVGLDRLVLEPVCQSSAIQRSGRAGRIEPGICIRLWDERTHRSRPDQLDAEIRRIDLSAAILQLYAWGESPQEFPWFERPRRESIDAAQCLLNRLGAISDQRITVLGERMAQLPVVPRLARMLLASRNANEVHVASLVAALLSERSPFLASRQSSTGVLATPSRRQNSMNWRCDITQRLSYLIRFFSDGESATPFGEVHRGAAQSLLRIAQQHSRLLGQTKLAIPSLDEDELGDCVSRMLLAAFPDRLAKLRQTGGHRGRMVGGRGVKLDRASGVRRYDLFLCIDVDDGGTDALVRQASGIELTQLEQTETREDLFFNPTRKQVEARQRTYWDDLVLHEIPTAITDSERCRKLLFEAACRQFDLVLPDAKADFHHYLVRLECLSEWAPDLALPKCDRAFLEEILYELCQQKRSFADLVAAPWLDWLKSRLTDKQRKAIDVECPERIRVPSGKNLKLQYAIDKPPVLAVRIQEMFGCEDTPRIAFGRVPVLLHLLAPNMRPHQITDDLASFWKNTYPTVRKELRRRYPKHAWPDL